MFSAFKRNIPQLSIFHNPSSTPSQTALKLLNASLSSPYPPSKPGAGPLTFNLEVIENSPPTPDQLRIILSYLPTAAQSKSPADTFLSAHFTVEARPNSAAGIVKIAAQNPRALNWPIVVDWTGGRAAVGDVDGVKGILEELRKRRDGEVKGEEVDQPKGWFS